MKAHKLGRFSWTKKDNLHITVKFIGQTPLEKLNVIKQIGEKTAAEIDPFTITLTGLGIFPNFKSSRVLWINLSIGQEILIKINRTINDQLAVKNILLPKNNFLPHLTIARIKSIKNKQLFKQTINTPNIIPVKQMDINNICLYQSNLSASGAIHTLLNKFFLKG